MERAWKIEAMSIFGFWINPSFKSTLESRTFLQPSFEAEMPEMTEMDEAAGPPGWVHPEIDKNSPTFKKNK